MNRVFFRLSFVLATLTTLIHSDRLLASKKKGKSASNVESDTRDLQEGGEDMFPVSGFFSADLARMSQHDVFLETREKLFPGKRPDPGVGATAGVRKAFWNDNFAEVFGNVALRYMAIAARENYDGGQVTLSESQIFAYFGGGASVQLSKAILASVALNGGLFLWHSLVLDSPTGRQVCQL